MTKKEIDQIIGLRPFLSLKGMAKVTLFFLGCLLLFAFTIFYLMGDKMSEGGMGIPDKEARTNTVEVVSSSFTAQKGITGLLMREVMLISVYQVTTKEKKVMVMVDKTAVPDFEKEANFGNLKLQLVEGRQPGFYPDMAVVRERMIAAVKSPWRGRLFFTLSWFRAVFGKKSSQDAIDQGEEGSFKAHISLAAILLLALHFTGERRRRAFHRNFKEKDLLKAKDCSVTKVRHSILLKAFMALLRIENSVYQIDGTSVRLHFSGHTGQKLKGRFLKYEGHYFFFPNKNAESESSLSC